MIKKSFRDREGHGAYQHIINILRINTKFISVKYLFLSPYASPYIILVIRELMLCLQVLFIFSIVHIFVI